jgi:hypothetical protein
MPLKYFAPKLTVKLYHRFFILEITVVKIINNLNVCSAHSYLYTRSRFNTSYVCFIFILCDFFLSLIDISLRIPLCWCISTVSLHNYNRLAALCPYWNRQFLYSFRCVNFNWVTCVNRLVCGVGRFILTRLYRAVFIFKLMC